MRGTKCQAQELINTRAPSSSMAQKWNRAMALDLESVSIPMDAFQDQVHMNQKKRCIRILAE